MAAIATTNLPRLGWLLLACLALAAQAAPAEDRKGGGEQVRRLQQKLMALQREQGELAQGKAELEAQLKEQGEKLAQAGRRAADTARAQKAALDKAIADADAEKAALVEKLGAAEQSAGEKATLLAASNAALRATEAARLQLEKTLATRSQSLAECGAKNDSLHRLGVNALTLYQQKSCMGGAAQLEVLTRLQQVGVENMVDELRDKLDAEALSAPAAREQQRRQAEQQRQQQERAVREKAELAERERLALRQARQQSALDKVSKQVKGWLENIEW